MLRAVLSILFEDDDLVIINKPPLLPVHATHDKTRPHVQGILEKQLGVPLTLFHRLDLETTGTLVFGKRPEMNAPMTDLFRDRGIEKKYALVVDGAWRPEWIEVKTFIKKVTGGRYQNVPKGKGGDFAHTLFALENTNRERSLVEATLLTGRTHQIRLHCQEMKHAILGDKLYGRRDPSGTPMALHAKSLRFVHPRTKQELSIVAPLPDYWSTTWLKGLSLFPETK